VYLEYKHKDDAQKAQTALGGRKFNGRTVITGFFGEDRYKTQEFAPDEYEEKACAEKYRQKQEEKDKLETEHKIKTMMLGMMPTGGVMQ
jgi:hypothetical protein